MSTFKTKKIKSLPPQTETNVSEIPSTLKKRIRIGIGIFLAILVSAFLINLWLSAMGNIRISNTEVAFKPIIFWSSEKKDEASINILIAGIWGKWHEWWSLTDSLMLANLNPNTKKVTLLSIPRDLFVAYGKWSAGRINALYGLWKENGEWINLLAKKVSEITGQPIHHYLVIDFWGFKELVDALGRVEVDVPHDLVDREYPDDNWGYTTFVVRAGRQEFDGATALKYARSRHSTSDFDRSERQQLLLKAIKSRVLQTEILTSPTKIQWIYDSLISHIDSDLTLGNLVDIGLKFQEIPSDQIYVYNLNNSCFWMSCSAGAYLYTPSREYFGWASAVIPEWASISKLSTYDDIVRFVNLVFLFPELKTERYPINIIASKANEKKAKRLYTELQKLWIQFEGKNNILLTGSIENSHVTIYRNDEADIGFKEDAPIIKVLKFLDETIPYSFTTHNEYITDAGPRIEIILGKDMDSYFTFAKTPYYLPEIESSTGKENWINSSEVKSEKVKSIPSSSIKKDVKVEVKSPSEYSIEPGQWEEF